MSSYLAPRATTSAPSTGMTIGEAAEASGLSIDTLRYYEREGLTLEPPRRTSAGRRRYGDRDLVWLQGLVMLRETGMAIAELREVARLVRREGSTAELLAIFERHREQVLAELERTRRHLAGIDRKIAAYRAVLNT